jgi:GDP-4-dehydro-6-deoxy-D-mannose reductase
MERGSPAQPGLRNLVTGANGFVGRYLVDALLARGEKVVALTRGRSPIRETPAESYSCDLAEGDIGSLLRETRPTCIYHLAGFSDAGASVRRPEAAWRDNLVATERLLGAVRESKLSPRMLTVSSGLVYGKADDDRDLLDETSLLRPESPYAQSKLAAEQAVEQFGRDTGIEVIRARPFNHTGPGQSPRFAIPGFAQRLALIAGGAEPPILKTGNLDIERDLCDVRDVVAAYLLLMANGTPGDVYNIASGTSIPMRKVVERMIELSHLEVELRTCADLVRPNDPASVRVAVGKLRRLGWAPQHTLDDTLRDTMAAWQRRGLENKWQE